VRLISWNIARQAEPWNILAADPTVDIALLQEATPPPAGLDLEVRSTSDWSTEGPLERAFTTAIVRCSDAVEISAEPATVELRLASASRLPVSRMGTIAAAVVNHWSLDAPITVVSVYAAWERPITSEGRGWIYADASAHRLISDISALIGRQSGHRIVVAGDWNVLHGYGEGGSTYWAGRYQTVFDRMESLGLRFVGPQQPNGHPAEDPAVELPTDSRDVPTFRTRRDDPATARRQLDFVFASEALVDSIRVTALNGRDQWGPSDHCRITIDIEE
jgi:exonuclease III